MNRITDKRVSGGFFPVGFWSVIVAVAAVAALAVAFALMEARRVEDAWIERSRQVSQPRGMSAAELAINARRAAQNN
jgi:anti-sigma-K factor RskA